MFRNRGEGTLRSTDIGKEVTLAGWVARRRDHGGVAFIDLRDGTGNAQVVISDAQIGSSLRSEWCVQIVGTVTKRPAGNENPGIPTGEIEVACN